MNAPTPEEINAAARALYVEQNWHTVNAELDEDPAPKSEYKRMAGLLWDKNGLGYETTKKYLRLAESALTAAAPIMQARALREAAKDFAEGEWVDAFITANDDIDAVKAVDEWLNERANQVTP